jgi:hypothetical protein
MKRFALLCCGISAFAVTPAAAQTFDGRAYADQAIALVRDHALAADHVDWDAAGAELHRAAANAHDPFDVYPALVSLLDRLGDQHSFLQLGSERAAAYQAAKGHPFAVAPDHHPLVERAFVGRSDAVAADIARDGAHLRTIVVPAFSGNRAAIDAFAATLYRDVVKAPSVCGYVLDFRGNTGGNMWPMIAGLGPLLGNGTFGTFLSPGSRERIFHEDGRVGIRPDGGEEQVVVTLPGWDTHPALAAAPVAVLIDGGAASSGEIVPILFVGRANTRFIGTPTYGSTTGTEGFQLPDGANLVIATSALADRNGHDYPGSLNPDDNVTPIPGGADSQMAAALEWLAREPGCR